MHLRVAILVALGSWASGYSPSGGSSSGDSLKVLADLVNTLNTTWKAEAKLEETAVRMRLGALWSGGLLEQKHNLGTIKDLPEEFDARKEWPYCPLIGVVRDQGNCGSCWAVAPASVLSDRLCIASKGEFTDLLSDEELLACCPNCGYGCDGGYPAMAWLYTRNHGIVTGGLYNTSQGCQPYSFQSCEHHTKGPRPPCTSVPEGKAPKCQKTCTNPQYKKPFLQDHHYGTRPYTLRKGDERNIRLDIMTNGPVAATFTVFSDFATYKSGVYQHVGGKLLGGHAVKVFGWGTEDGTPYWLAANSWNEDWGDRGMFKIRRGVNECEFEQEVTADVPLYNRQA